MPRDLRMSTMKSAPGWSVVRTSTADGSPVSALLDIGGAVAACAAGFWAAAGTPLAAMAATPAAEPFKKSRRLTACFPDFPTEYPLTDGDKNWCSILYRI